MYYTSARITHAYIYTSRMCIVYMLANLDNYYTHSLHAVRFAAPPIKPRQNALPVSPSILSILFSSISANWYFYHFFCVLIQLVFFRLKFCMQSSFFSLNSPNKVHWNNVHFDSIQCTRPIIAAYVSFVLFRFCVFPYIFFSNQGIVLNKCNQLWKSIQPFHRIL